MGDIIKVLKMLRITPDLVNDKDKLSRVPLHWACRRGYAHLVNILLDFGADVTQKDNFDKTPKDMAIEKDFLDMAKVIYII